MHRAILQSGVKVMYIVFDMGAAWFAWVLLDTVPLQDHIACMRLHNWACWRRCCNRCYSLAMQAAHMCLLKAERLRG